jgi:hypothetical protein
MAMIGQLLILLVVVLIVYVIGRRDGIAYATNKINELLESRGLPPVQKKGSE